MTGVAQTGAQIQLNALTGAAVPVVSGSAPTWVPGMYWVDTGSGNAIKSWNGTSWAVSGSLYLALLTADPSGLTTVASLTECTDAGYTRQAVTFSAATAAVPSVASNSSLIQFGAFSVNMTLPAQWLALVTSSTGTTGFLLETWTLSEPQQVLSTQSVDVAASALNISQS